MARVLKLFSDIIITDGYQRALIQDYHRHKKFFIPLYLSDLIKKYDGIIEKDYVLSLLENGKNPLFQEYYDFLTENDLIFSVEKKNVKLYPKISHDYKMPFKIDNVTILITNHNYKNIFKAFDKGIFNYTYCFKLIFCDEISSVDMDSLLGAVISKEHRYLCVVHNPSANNSKILQENKDPLIMEVKLDKKVDSNICYNDSLIEFPIFFNEFFLYIEALKFNPYFHKRLFIDGDGYLRNTPETPSSRFKISDIHNVNDLFEIVESPSFSKYSNIPKSKIEVCRCCEYRYMCVDNRIPRKEGKRWIYTDSCPYNPYICTWKGQEGYIPVEECGTYSRETGFIPNKEKIAELNKQLWGEDE